MIHDPPLVFCHFYYEIFYLEAAYRGGSLKYYLGAFIIRHNYKHYCLQQLNVYSSDYTGNLKLGVLVLSCLYSFRGLQKSESQARSSLDLCDNQDPGLISETTGVT